MTQTEKDLLLKDLCSRLPYNNLKVRGVFLNYNKDIDRCVYEECDREFNHQHLERYETLKPYLFPISSMTEEQEIEFKGLLSEVYDFSFRMEELLEFIQSQENIPFHFIDWLSQNNFDYRGLIPMGLAKDATNLNIY